MAKQAVAKKIDTKVTKSRPRRGSKAPMIVEIATEHPDLTTREIGKLADCSHVNVITVLKRYGINRDETEDYKAHRGDIQAGIQNRILKSITDADIKAMPVGQRLMGYGILYDKERLERGQSTSNVDVRVTAALEVELSQIDKEIEILKGKSGITPPENTPQVGSNTHPITTTLSGTNPT